MTDKLLLSVNETAELVGVSPNTIYRWISTGVNGRRLKTVQAGVTRIRRRTINEFLESLERAA